MTSKMSHLIAKFWANLVEAGVDENSATTLTLAWMQMLMSKR